MLAAGLDEVHRRDAVDAQVELRIAHAVAVAHLAGEVEDEVLVADEDLQRGAVAHVGDVDRHPVGDGLDVGEVAAELRDQGVQQRDVGPLLDQRDGQVAAQEPQAAGDQHAASAELFKRLHCVSLAPFLD